MSDEDLKSYGDVLVGVDSHSLANDPLAKTLDKLSTKDKVELAEMMGKAAEKALEYIRCRNEKQNGND
jgi:hypothetical protein